MWRLHFRTHSGGSPDSLEIFIPGWSSLQYDRDALQLSLLARDCFPLDLNACDRPLDGSVDSHEFLILLLDKLVNEPASVARGDFFHDTFHIVLGLLELPDVALEILCVDMLLLRFNVFPAFGAPLSLQCEERELRIVFGVTIL